MQFTVARAGADGSSVTFSITESNSPVQPFLAWGAGLLLAGALLVLFADRRLGGGRRLGRRRAL